MGYQRSEKDYTAVPRSETAEDLVRHAAFMILLNELKYEWSGNRTFPKTARIFDVDCKAIMNEVAPLPKVPRKKAIAKKTQTKEKGKSPKRKTRGKATA